MHKVIALLELVDVELIETGDASVDLKPAKGEIHKLTFREPNERVELVRELRNLQEEKKRSRSTSRARSLAHPLIPWFGH